MGSRRGNFLIKGCVIFGGGTQFHMHCLDNNNAMSSPMIPLTSYAIHVSQLYILGASWCLKGGRILWHRTREIFWSRSRKNSCQQPLPIMSSPGIFLTSKWGGDDDKNVGGFFLILTFWSHDVWPLNLFTVVDAGNEGVNKMPKIYKIEF